MSVSVKRKPIYCGSCSMDITNAVRIRCAQLGPPPAPPPPPPSSSNDKDDPDRASTRTDGSSPRGAGSAKDASTSNNPPKTPTATSGPTRKYDPIDSLPTAPRSDGLVPTCDEFDICGTCFCEGKEVGRHKRWHDYRVVTQHAYPIFTDDWGADEELLLISACQTFGLGNWADIAEHIGSYRTKEEVETHYLETYINSPDFPLPNTDVKLIDQETFQARKKQRLEEAQARPVPQPPPKPLASAPTCHEIAGYMPGRLEFETEWENDAEGLIKDMEFGLVHRYGGDDQPTREEAMAANGSGERIREDSAKLAARDPQTAAPSSRGLGAASASTAAAEGDGEGEEGGNVLDKDDKERKTSTNILSVQKTEEENMGPNATGEKGKEDDAGGNGTSESAIAVWDETNDDLELKLTIMEIYNERIDRRLEAKGVIFERGLLDYKKLVALEKKRPKEERDLLNRIKVFSRLQTAQDHEELANGLLYEEMLRKQISTLQEYRQAGLTSFHEIEKYEKDKAARVAARGGNSYRDVMLLSRAAMHRTPSTGVSSREGTPKLSSGLSGSGTASGNLPHKKGPQPQLTLSNAASLQLLTPRELQLCSELHILPKPYLFIKQSLLREFARNFGRLEKENAVELLAKVNPVVVVRVWDELFGRMDAIDDDDEDDDDEDDSDDDDDEDDDEDDEEGDDDDEDGAGTGGGAMDLDDSDDSSSSDEEGDLMGELQETLAQQQQQQQSVAGNAGAT